MKRTLVAVCVALLFAPVAEAQWRADDGLVIGGTW